MTAGLAALLLLTAAAGAPQQAALFDELEPLYPDSDPAGGVLVFESHHARGTIAGVDVLVTGLDPGSPLTLFSAGAPEAAEPVWYRLHPVPVEENTGLGSRTEQFQGERNPFVIRRAPFEVFEAMEALQIEAGSDDVPSRRSLPDRHPAIRSPRPTEALRLEIAVPAEVEAAVWSLEIGVGNGPDLWSMRWRIHVHEAVVPPSGRDTLRYTNWYSPGEMARRHGLEPWSEPHWQMIRRYAGLMARGRQNVFWIPWGEVFALGDDGQPFLRRQRLERWVRTFREAGLWWIEGAPLARRPGGDWSKDRLELAVAGVLATSPEGRAALARMLGALEACLVENGWKDAWLQHLADEPTDVNAADYRELAAVVRELLPGAPIVEATMSRELVGAVDVWCPQVQVFQAQREFFEQRRAAGDRLWTYTCLVPGGPWLNRLLDQERLRQVWFGWAAAEYRLDGFLHWGFNHYKADPFARSVVDHPAQPGTKNKLPAGDTHIVYPGPDGPWSGLRFEAHRVGLEDRELLELLRARDPAAYERIVARVFRAYDDYETGVAEYRAAKRELLEALDDR